MKRNKIFLIPVLALFAGFMLRGCFIGTSGNPGSDAKTAVAKEEIWTCSMHPQIRQNHPGQRPICAMDLIPVATGGSTTEAGPRELVLSEAAQKLAEIETSPVERRSVAAEIEMLTGKETDGGETQ